MEENREQEWWKLQEARKERETAEQIARVQEYYDAQCEHMHAQDRLAFLRAKTIYNMHSYDSDIEAAEMSGEFLLQVTIVQQAWLRHLVADLALRYGVVVNQEPKPPQLK